MYPNPDGHQGDPSSYIGNQVAPDGQAPSTCDKGDLFEKPGISSLAKVFIDHLNILFKWSKTKVAKLISTPELLGG